MGHHYTPVWYPRQNSFKAPEVIDAPQAYKKMNRLLSIELT